MMTVTRIDLAHEVDFNAGPLTILPRTRELIGPDGEPIVLEHRVMQVLVALARADGGIVTRDDLIDSCWDGRIVGEDAINRVISRLRKAVRKVGEDIARIETLNKIGYRLILDAEGRLARPPSRLPTLFAMDRRGVMLGSGALALLGGGAWYNRSRERGAVSPEIRDLLDQSRQLLGQNTRDAQNQSIGLLRNVVELAPTFADGWGRLGIAYGVVSHYRERPEAQSLRVRAESAAQQALELDPDNACGEIARSVALPLIGHYLERDRCQRRALKAEPDNYDAIVYTATALPCVGRNLEAVSLFRRLPDGPLTPADHNNLILGLWSAGQIEDADRELDKAASLYPTQVSIWLTRLYIKLYNGEFDAAIALAHDTRNAPTGTVPERVARFDTLAKALETQDSKQVDAVTRLLVSRARLCMYEAELALRGLSALGRVNEAFDVANAYYFSSGYSVPDFFLPGSDSKPGSSVSIDQRQTRLLFEPVTAPMRADPRFETLVSKIGLERYWQTSGSPPDYRKT
ncbi:winged helix-turn-helix domain-containing protein [Croceicoccus bisphenolivorans]|uniref:winged helix-turn-helix domain-containing protein n=1 Tax=Croceicoccus bisphenolivorans TaxID=1783232 RepID=UPI0008314A42|nr:winged helix-turn-helix domain-containing protein [Croceicoccus bisphenolivorans]